MYIFGALMGFSLLFGATTLPFGRVVEPLSPAVASRAEPDHIVTLTAYNAVSAQTDSDPLITASGAYSNPEVVIARSVDLAKALPFGTIVELDGSAISQDNTCGYHIIEPLVGYRVVADSMNARYTSRVDLLFNVQEEYVKPSGKTMNAAKVLGVCNGVGIRVVGYVDINKIPKTQAELARLVKNGEYLALK